MVEDPLRLANILDGAMQLAMESRGEYSAFTERTALGDIETEIHSCGGELARLLSEAALLAFRRNEANGPRTERNALRFFVSDARPVEQLIYTENSTVRWHLEPPSVEKAVLDANRTIELVHDLAASNNAPIFELLGLRNLSSFVGEIFAGALNATYRDRFLRNPNQDGHPDLMALTPEGRRYISERTADGQLDRAKRHWSPYPFGGVEVKATCGNTPSSREAPKPRIGEARIAILQSAEWKAHHRETNNLLGLFWDFLDGLPTIFAAFFRNDLIRSDWGEVVRPGAGSRTTSVSIMSRAGVLKMGAGWVVLPRQGRLLHPLGQRSVFGITGHSISSNCSDRSAPTLLG